MPCLYTGFLSAQEYQSLIAVIDARIRMHQNPDSVDALLLQGARLSRAHDHLQNWVSYTLEYLGRDQAYRDTLQNGKVYALWKAPGNAEEASIAVHYYRHMGYYYARDGNVPLSTEYYHFALDAYDHQRIDEFNAFEEIFKPLGNNYLRLGDFAHAESIGFRMQDWLQDVDDPSAKSAYFNYLGLLQKLKGVHALAKQAFERGLEMKDADPAVLGKLASNLSLLYSEQGEDVQAELYAFEALQYLQQIPSSHEVNEDLAKILLLIAQIRTHRQDFNGAYEFIEHALSLSPDVDTRTYAKMLVVRGNILVQAGYPEHAIRTFHAAIAQFDPAFRPDSLFDNPRIENVPAENTVFEALEGKADALLSLHNVSGEQHYAARALDCHLLALQAELQLRNALSTEFSRNVLASDSKRRNSKALALLSILDQKDGIAQDALYLMESAKANAVLEAIASRMITDGQDSTRHELTEQIRRYERALHQSRSRGDTASLERIGRDVNQLKLRLAAERAGRIRQLPAYTSILSDQFKRHNTSDLNPDSSYAIIEYFLHDNTGYTVVITRNEHSFVPLRDVGQIRAVTMALVSLLHAREITNTSMQEFGRKASWLHERLIADLIRGRSDISTLIIIPDGELNYLPFEVLLQDYDDRMTYATMPYLIRDYSIHYGHSVGVLSLQSAMHVKTRRGIAFAPFQTSIRGLSDLGHSMDEVRTSAGFELKKFTGMAAGFSEFIKSAPSARFIHLATHAGVDSTGQGHIEFADSSLLLSDIYYLPLQCELAILSACESAFGENLPSEGIQNFARAFAIAGTKSVIASHWRLNDASGTQTIRSFYQHLRKGQSIASSLRNAKIDYLNSPDVPALRKSPHYWAPLVMIGADGQVEPGVSTSILMSIAVIAVVLVLWIGWRFFTPYKNARKSS